MNKTVLKLSACVILALAGSTFRSQAQSVATATASATIITPISITKSVDLDFGNLAVQTTTGGTVVMTPAGSRTNTAGVTLPASSGAPTAASFTVNGEDGYTFAITLPNNVTISDNSSNTMTVDNFVSVPSGTGTLTGGTETITVGATLNVAAGQAAGTYTSATPFNVTVNYN